MPTVASAIADATIVNESGTKQVSLSGVFHDADGMAIMASPSNYPVASAWLSADSTLTVVGMSEGTATITVTARNSDGNQVSDAFDVTVVNPFLEKED